MSEKSPAYLWYPKDVLTSGRVSEMTAQEECWYRRALDHSWLDEGLPADPAKVARRVAKGCTVKAARMILETFFIADKKLPDWMRNEKQEKLRKELRQKTAKRKEAGRLSGIKRREQRDLATEQSSNYEGTKTNIAIPIAITKIKEIREEKNKAKSDAIAEPPQSAAVNQVFEHWQIRLSKQAFRLTPLRKTKIQARLNDGFTVEQLKQAIDAVSKDAFYLGQNDRKREFVDFSTIFKTADKVEEFIHASDIPPEVHPLTAYRDPYTGRAIGEFGR